NTTEVTDLLNNWIFEVVLNGSFSVDSFFVLSGFLVAYLYFQQCSKNGGKIPWLYFYIHRYIRLTPVYMIVVAYFTTLHTYSNSGPQWPDDDVEAYCKAGWWWNLLYINNLQDKRYLCMNWSWYLSNDMQFYIISPLLLISLRRWPKIGYSLMGLIFAISFAAYFAITYEYDFDVTLESIAADGIMNAQRIMDKNVCYASSEYWAYCSLGFGFNFLEFWIIVLWCQQRLGSSIIIASDLKAHAHKDVEKLPAVRGKITLNIQDKIAIIVNVHFKNRCI
ncbi:nose resistant to fluoxetine protein 6, partial [Caerostris extrusa]